MTNKSAVRGAALAAGRAVDLIELGSFQDSHLRQEPVAATVMATVTPSAAIGVRPVRSRYHDGILIFSALGLASVSAWFSITGLNAIFIGAFWPVIALGVALEVGKLSAVSALPTLRWGPLKVALAALVAALMGLNMVGCFGFLSKAQIEHTVLEDAAIEARAAQVQAKITTQVDVVADLDRRIAQIDGAVAAATARGRVKVAMTVGADQKANRAGLVIQRQHEAEVLADLRTHEAGIMAQRRIAAVDLGPVRYLAELVGVPAESMLKWFIFLVACLLDPAAVLLLLAANHRR